jgi:hypothetical protein
MYPKTFTALSHPDLDDRATTFAKRADIDTAVSESPLVPTIGGGLYDARGTRPSIAVPMRRTISYDVKCATAHALDVFIENLAFTDRGKRGTLTYRSERNPVTTKTCTARLLSVTVRRPFQEFGQTRATIELVVEEVTKLA